MQWSDLAGEVRHLSPEDVKELDQLIARTIAGGVGYFQAVVYVQVERGLVRQVGISPVLAVSIRFPDRGRRSN